MKLNLEAVSKLISDGYISVQKHPDAEIYIYNYTHKAQFDKVWNEHTMLCRGLICDQDGNVLYRPFKKFFNLEEHLGQKKELPTTPFKVHEKLDGSLGIIYKVNGQYAVATRGSFKSEQALHATEILRTKYPNFRQTDDMTVLVEIIYPENRIVVDYKGKDDLIFLAAIYNETGETLIAEERAVPMPRAKVYTDVTDIMKLTEKERDNEEGYVIEWDNGLRLKVKFSEYKRLHWLLSSVNSKTIWDLLREGSDIDKVLDHVPDEFYDWVKKVAAELNFSFNEIESSCKKSMVILSGKTFSGTEHEARKQLAQFFQKRPYSKILFAMYDKRDYKDMIWKMIKPIASKPFKNNLDL